MQPAVTQLERTHTETTNNTLSARRTHTHTEQPKALCCGPFTHNHQPSPPAQVPCADSHTEQGRNTVVTVLHLAEPQLLLQESKAASILS